jgi:hypothetical protein
VGYESLFMQLARARTHLEIVEANPAGVSSSASKDRGLRRDMEPKPYESHQDLDCASEWEEVRRYTRQTRH